MTVTAFPSHGTLGLDPAFAINALRDAGGRDSAAGAVTGLQP